MIESWAFLIFGLGFFLFTVHMITRDQRTAHQQRVAETREFGKPISDRDKKNYFGR